MAAVAGLRRDAHLDRPRGLTNGPGAVEDPVAKGEQTWAVQLSDTARALRALPAEQREALILVGAGGFSYEDAASISNCAGAVSGPNCSTGPRHCPRAQRAASDCGSASAATRTATPRPAR